MPAIYSLADLRATAPETMRDASDVELVKAYSDWAGLPLQQVAEQLGMPTGGKRNPLAAGLSSGTDDLQGLGYSAAAAGADAVGLTGARDWLNKRAAMNQAESELNGRPDLEQVEGVWDQPGKWAPFAAYQVAKQVPNIAASLAATIAVPEAAVPAWAARAGAVVPRILGGGGLRAGMSEAEALAAQKAGMTFARTGIGGGSVNYGQGVGSLYQESVESGHPDSGVAALAGGVPYAAMETLPEEMMFGRMAHGSGFKGGMGLRMAKSAGAQALSGATSELGQNEMEMAYNGQVTPDQAFSKRLNSGVTGGLVEGLIGSMGGIRRHGAPVRTLDEGATDLTGSSSAPAGQLGYSPLAGTPIVFPDGSVALNGDQELAARYPNQPDGGLSADQSPFPQRPPTAAPAPVAPAWDLAQGAGATLPQALSPNHIAPGPIDTSGMGMAPEPDVHAIGFQPQDTTPQWSTSPGAAAPQQGGLTMPGRQINTANLSLQPNAHSGTMDLFTGEVRPHFAPDQRPEFDLQSQDARQGNQMELPLPAPAAPAPQVPVTPQPGVRATGQLPFSGATKSPKGQVLMGLVDSLHDEGHLDDGGTAQVTTLIAKGRFGEAKKILDSAIAEKTAADALLQKQAKLEEKANANPTGTGQQRAGAPAIAGGVQRTGGQPDAGGVQRAAAPVTESAPAGVQDAPAVPADTRGSALEAVTTEALTEAADNAKDPQHYESALDEMYRRWRDDGDEVAAKYFESNQKVPGFKADMARVRERAGEKAQTAEPQAKGKRGLKLGRAQTGTLTEGAKATDDVMRGLATPKFRLSEDSNGKPLPAGRIEAVVGQLDLPHGPEVHVVDSPEDIGLSSPGGGTAMGVMTKGKVFLFRTGITSDFEAVRTLFHELFHYGLRRMLPPEQYHEMMKRIAMRDPRVAELAKRWMAGDEGKARRALVHEGKLTARAFNSLAVEEALADIVEELKTNGVGTKYNQTVRNIARWLAEVADTLGLRELGNRIRSMTHTESEKFVLDALDHADHSKPDARVGQNSQPAVEAPAKPVEAEPAKFAVREPSPAGKAMSASFASFPGAKSTLGQKIQDALFNLSESPWALKWTTSDQIGEGYKHLKPVQDIIRATGRMGATANRYVETAVQTAKRWRALDDATQLAMQKVMLQSTMDEMHVSIKGEDGKYLGAEQAWMHPSNDHLDRTPLLRAKFGLLHGAFTALPAQAKHVHDTVRDDLARQHEDTLSSLRRSVADQYTGQLQRLLSDAELKALAMSPSNVREAIKDLATLANSPTELRVLNNMYRQLRDLTKDFGTLRGPYFPLVRFGDHVVVMKSADLVQLELEATGLRAELQHAMETAPAAGSEDAEAHGAKVDDIRARYNTAMEAVAKAKQDDKKYVVEFHESAAQAERAKQAFAEKFPGADVYRSVREQYFRALDGASPAFLKSMQETLGAALDSGDGVSAEAKNTALTAMRDMYLRRQPERSALRSELKRMSIEGVQAAQMLRGYAQASRNGAWRISRLQHAGEVTKGLAELSGDHRNADAKHVLNELKSRFVGDLAPATDNKWFNRLGNATYFMHLGFNLSYFTTNATQAWLISLPVMSGRHGLVNSSNSLMAASKDVIRLLGNATVKSVQENGVAVGIQLRLTDEQIKSLAHDEGEAKMLKALTEDGVIDITIKHDLGAISDGTTSSMPGKLMELSSALANFPELYNRLSTALAAYRMEKAYRGEGRQSAEQVQQRAEEYAERIINRTHFNYSPENAPRVMRGQLGRLVFQFKRYQQGMIYLYAKLIKDSSNGDADSRRGLAYLLGATVGIGGVVALPIAAPIALAMKVMAAIYPDDDEPDWLTNWYNGLKDAIGETAAQAMVKGAPTLAGLDLSAKLGQGDMLNPIAFADTSGKKVFSKDYWQAVGFSLLGPSSAMLANEMEATGAAMQGDWVKAAEKGLPVFLANPIKALDRANSGIESKQGDTLMEPAEFNALATAAKAMGFEGVKVSDMYQERNSFANAVQGRKEARQRLLRDLYEAIKDGDTDKVQSAQDAISGFNDRQPSDAIGGDDIRSSIERHGQTAPQMHGGLRVTPRDRDTYRRVTGRE